MSRDSAFWQGRYATFWVAAAVDLVLLVAFAVALEYPQTGIALWGGLAGSILAAWLISAIILIPRDSQSSKNMEEWELPGDQSRAAGRSPPSSISAWH